MVHLNNLQLKRSQLLLKDAKTTSDFYQMMIAALNRLKPHFQLHYYSINIEGFRLSVPNHCEKLQSINRKIKLFNRGFTFPPRKEAPSALADLVVFPGTSSLRIFQRIQKEVRNLSFADVCRELKTLTDVPQEFDLIMDIAFEFAWRGMQYPFIGSQPQLPTFHNVRVELFDVSCLDEKFRRLRIGQLVGSGWPFDAAVKILSELPFLISPAAMGKVFSDAMTEIATKLPGKDREESGLDTVLPLTVVCALAAGLTSDPRLLPFVGELAVDYPADLEVRFGATTAAAVLEYIRDSLDEKKMLEKTKELDRVEREKERCQIQSL
jgi:hypothetical protein